MWLTVQRMHDADVSQLTRDIELVADCENYF